MAKGEMHQRGELRWRREEHEHPLFRFASDIFTVVEVDGTIRYESPTIEEVLGYRPEELVGQNASGYVHPEDLEEVLEAFAEAYWTQGPRGGWSSGSATGTVPSVTSKASTSICSTSPRSRG